MNVRKWTDLVKQSVVAWSDDYAPSMGAAISYYTLFSLAPLLVLVIAVAGLVFGAEAVRGQISDQLSALMGPETAQAIEGMVESATVSDGGLWASLASIVVLLVGATSVFSELQSALDRIWHVPEAKKPTGIWGLLRARIFSLGLILGLAFLLMVSLAVSAGLAAFGTYVGGLLPGQELLLQVLNTVLAVAVTTVLFAMIFKLMPTAKVAWHDVWVGAVVTALLFEVGKLLIGLYIGKCALASSFAGAGALVILLAWVYYAAQIFLLGAEFTKVYAHTHGSVHQQGDLSGSSSSEMLEPKQTDRSNDATAPLRPTSNQVQKVTVQTSRKLLPQILLLGGVVLVRLIVQARLKREQKLIKQAKKSR